MLPLRLVLDTNVVVSAALNPNGLPRTVLTMALTKPARLCVSQPILAEYKLVLGRPELRIRRPLQRQLLQLIRNAARLLHPKRAVFAAADLNDDIFLECAETARADYLVTGNLRHFPRFWRQTKIVNAREFVDLLAPHLLE